MTSYARQVQQTVSEMADPQPSLAHKTAMARTTASVPVRWLHAKGLLQGRVLDYGCGQGDIVKFLQLPNAEQYDPYFFPEKPQGLFDTVYCGYVFNVVPREHHKALLRLLWRYLAPGGRAYLAVRRDVKKEGPTSIGTEQYNVVLPLRSVVHRRGSFEIYVMRKGQRQGE